jgi:NADH-quinone oxidoreductase subunit H
MLWLDLLIGFIIFPGLAFSTMIGFLYVWIERKLRAKMQGRIGPPFYQPFFDFLKLISKKDIIPQGANSITFNLTPILALSSLIVVSLLVPFGLRPVLSFNGDILIVIYLFSLLSISYMIAGSSSPSPYSMVGTKRMAIQFISYEFPFILSIINILLLSGSISLSEIFFSSKKLSEFIFYLLPFITIVLTIPAKLMINPFSIPNADTEIIDGPFTEYSGKRLALFYLTHCMERPILYTLLYDLFFPPMESITLIFQIIFSIIITFLVTVLATVTARLKIDQLTKFYMLYVNTLAIIGLIFSIIKTMR